MTEPQIHEYTLPLYPTPGQAHMLDHISRALAQLERACEEQLRSGPELMLSMLAPSQRDSAAYIMDDAQVMASLAAATGLPHGVTQNTVQGCLTRASQGRPRARRTELPAVAGDGLITPVPDGVIIAGVAGVVRADIDRLPRWAAAVFRRAAGHLDADPGLQLTGATLTDWGYVERGTYDGTEGWLLDIALRWDEHPEWVLAPHYEEPEEMDAERRAAAHLMVRG